MGQKVHPLGLRIGITQEHRSKWFAKYKGLSKLNYRRQTFTLENFKKISNSKYCRYYN